MFCGPPEDGLMWADLKPKGVSSHPLPEKTPAGGFSFASAASSFFRPLFRAFAEIPDAAFGSRSTFCLLIRVNQFNPSKPFVILPGWTGSYLCPVYTRRRWCLCEKEAPCVSLTFDTVSDGTGSGPEQQNRDNRWMVVRVPFRITCSESDLLIVASLGWKWKHVTLRFVCGSPVMSGPPVHIGIQNLRCFVVFLSSSCQKQAQLLSAEVYLIRLPVAWNLRTESVEWFGSFHSAHTPVQLERGDSEEAGRAVGIMQRN